ncbi:four F5 protein [Nemania sp. FL0916]|nr:four F5 protein [Nemania sp. FL0916]
MARGNQRDKAREKNLKQQAAQTTWDLQKSKNTKTGSEMQRDKEALAALMRQKQEAADAKKAAGAAGGKK